MSLNIKYISYIIISSLLGMFTTACREDLTDCSDFAEEKGELPVELMFEITDIPTRAISNPKTKFSANDLIHVSGTFTLSITDEITGEAKTETRYGAFYYDASKSQWKPVAASGLTWPVTAERGVFEAYYIGTNYNPSSSDENAGGLLTTPVETLLSNVKTNADPLYATTPEGSSVAYGNAVRMNFRHICTYLSLEEIRPIYSSAFYFTTDSRKKDASSVVEGFNNAFRLSLNTDNTLKFEFFPQEENGEVYVSSATTTDPQTGLVSVNFFLEPGYYDTFTLSYPSSTDNVAYPYLYYKYSDALGNTPPQLNAGVAYTLNIMNSPGITIDRKPEEGEGQWDEESPAIKVDPDDFLTAITNNSNYDFENQSILKKTEKGLELLCNVDLQFYEYTTLKDGSRASIPPNAVLEGNLHYIHNVGSPMFATNRGTIQNLGIKKIKIENVLVDQSISFSKEDDASRQGGLCSFNRGKIRNMRISDVSITAQVKSDDDQDVDNIGCILGSNAGSLEEIRLSGNWTLSVSNNSTDGDGVNSNLYIGGLIGQNVGPVSDIAALDGETYSLTVNNSCTGANGLAAGAFYVGGLTGGTTSNIGTVNIPAVDIDCSASICTKSYVGLMAGTINEGVALVACNIGDGSAKSGSIDFKGTVDIDSGSYLGGIAGAIVPTTLGGMITVSDCIVIAKSLNNSLASAYSVINATGGCFGRIYYAYDGDFSISTINLFLNRLTYPSTAQRDQFYGTFAGLVPPGRSWADYSGYNIDITNNTTNVTQEVGGNTLAD